MAKQSKTLAQLLDAVAVYYPGEWQNEVGPKGWYAVSVLDRGILAYFQEESDAFRWRLAEINRIMNG
jgi:hypothetical protein